MQEQLWRAVAAGQSETILPQTSADMQTKPEDSHALEDWQTILTVDECHTVSAMRHVLLHQTRTAGRRRKTRHSGNGRVKWKWLITMSNECCRMHRGQNQSSIPLSFMVSILSMVSMTMDQHGGKWHQFCGVWDTLNLFCVFCVLNVLFLVSNVLFLCLNCDFFVRFFAFLRPLKMNSGFSNNMNP